MDFENIKDFLLKVATHYASPLVVTGIIGGIIGYLLKTYFEQYREKRKRRYTEFAEGLRELHALAAEVHSAFSSQSDTNKIFKSSEAYLLHFSKSTLPDSILNTACPGIRRK